MSGRLATQVAKDPRIHLTGYGPSASTVGANRASRAAAQELIDYLKSQEPKNKRCLAFENLESTTHHQHKQTKQRKQRKGKP